MRFETINFLSKLSRCLSVALIAACFTQCGPEEPDDPTPVDPIEDGQCLIR